ncbi:DUF5813 family protein [Halobacterium salinarum]|uniref:Uncharacterized protein n=4 Tax=Halobacterium salinarum TaxID=2242 RepID=Q9HNW0_HALSA|nr:DUF5813 family protein [Halobacterium salinarum]AAG20110.1 hypothetical protein VNG_1920H [Halobacterium salinarum NRC-1]MBB6089123.1 hypothetical protein [Halobacterium salinarum]MDL0119552.1 DUF5813 family protein [Halobacterium salinarum]MDL0126199.1 DUF5813 family protein [Halobacterium salinarum]MDL0132157.1 DUF5813 family protein [Halobacterium salinarum]
MDEIAGEFESHGRFRAVAERSFAPTTNDWEAVVAVEPPGVEIAVVVPTLDAATTEQVADVVSDGWYETFERRVRDADSVTRAEDVSVSAVTRAGGEITVTLTMAPRSGMAADDALALVNYVEGTWFQGIVPGYDYIEAVRAMREQAAQNAQEAGGTPL